MHAVRVPLSDVIHGWLRTAIIAVDLLPGSPLVEATIAARFSSSRTPVREALLRLADEALVEIRPQRGTSVARLELARIEEAQFVRQAVEGAVIRKICERRTNVAVSDQLGHVLQAHARALARDDIGAVLDADTDFHRTLVEASGLPGVWSVVARAREMHHRVRAIAVPELRSGRRALAEHRAVVRALRSGDPQRAETAMTMHLARNLELAHTLAARHPDYFRTTPGPAVEGSTNHGLAQRNRRAVG